MSATVEQILIATAGAIRHRTEGEFWAELQDWGRKSGIEMLGTEALEADDLADIIDALLRDPQTAKDVYARLAEMVNS